MIHILVKKVKNKKGRPVSGAVTVHGITEDIVEAGRWVDWAGGQLITADVKDKANPSKALLTSDEVGVPMEEKQG